jgi:hypothetical protein
MSHPGQGLDLILDTRLDVLAQAVDEVQSVITAMVEQRDRLRAVTDFLSEGGFLRRREDDLLEQIGDVTTRINVLLRPLAGPTSTALPQVADAEPSASPRPESDQQQRLQAMLESAECATKKVKEIATERGQAYGAFQDVRRWSVAGLVDTALSEAARDYQLLIDKIRRAESPWRRYQVEMPRRGHELFSRYLELLAGMAVRGIGLDAALMPDVDALVQLLMGPVPPQNKPTEQQRSPLALMGTLGARHMPLGYPDWSLWALPLVGRSAGDLVATNLLPADVDNQLRALCADLYAQYVLGPSYLHAAIFLEFDPSSEPPTPDAPPDPLRAAVLLEQLPSMYGDTDEANRKLVETIVERVAAEWRRARAAVGGAEPTLSGQGQDTVDAFLHDLAQFPEVAYPIGYLAEHADTGRDLLSGAAPDVPAMPLRDLVTAMWLARLETPTAARHIHQRAKTVARQGQGAAPTSANRVAPGRGGTWA